MIRPCPSLAPSRVRSRVRSLALAPLTHPSALHSQALAENHLPSSFEWTTIQLNLNYLSTLHVDRSNLGASYIIGFDDYDGGELYIYEQGTVCCKGYVCL